MTWVLGSPLQEHGTKWTQRPTPEDTPWCPFCWWIWSPFLCEKVTILHSHWAFPTFRVVPIMSDPHIIRADFYLKFPAVYVRPKLWGQPRGKGLQSQLCSLNKWCNCWHGVLFSLRPVSQYHLIIRGLKVVDSAYCSLVLVLNPISHSTTTLVSHPTKPHRWDVRPFIFTESGC